MTVLTENVKRLFSEQDDDLEKLYDKVILATSDSEQNITLKKKDLMLILYSLGELKIRRQKEKEFLGY